MLSKSMWTNGAIKVPEFPARRLGMLQLAMAWLWQYFWHGVDRCESQSVHTEVWRHGTTPHGNPHHLVPDPPHPVVVCAYPLGIFKLGAVVATFC